MIRIAVAVIALLPAAATAEIAGSTGGELPTRAVIGPSVERAAVSTGDPDSPIARAVGGELDGGASGTQSAADGDPAALYAVLARHGCAVSEPEVATLLGPEGFDPAFVTQHLSGLLVEGIAGVDHAGRLQLPASLCPPDSPAPSPRDRFVTAFSEAGCKMTDAEIRAALPDLDEAQLLAIATPMVEGGDLETGISGATLASDICTTD